VEYEVRAVNAPILEEIKLWLQEEIKFRDIGITDVPPYPILQYPRFTVARKKIKNKINGCSNCSH
jgi:hypothetical protein